MQIPILNGIYVDASADFRTSYPLNMVPVPKQQGISTGYLRPADGIVKYGDSPGGDRGAIVWRGDCYRVMGNSLVRLDTAGTVTTLGAVAGTGHVTFDYGFDQLGIAAGNALYYWDGATLKQVTDPDLGGVIDFIWIDGYFMTTDGTSLVVTELNDPFSVNPLKYGSSEADPDPIMGLLKLRNEAYALNRYTIEVFENVGGSLFPFQRIEGAMIQRGVVGTFAACVFMDQIAFVGGNRDEPPSVWIGVNGASAKIATREIDILLQKYQARDLANIRCEAQVGRGHQNLLIHLPDKTLVYDMAASEAVEEPVWYILSSSLDGNGAYRARNMVWFNDRWVVGDANSTAYGYLDEKVSTHYGERIGWTFDTAIIYNEGRGVIIHEMELVALPGRIPSGADPVIWTSYTVDGETWSLERPFKCGKQGQRNKRINWLQQGFFRNWRIQRFRGTSDSHLAVARLEARVEGMNV